MKSITSLVPLAKIKANPDNPRVMKDDKFQKLVASLETFPDMLELRPIVVDETWTVLGGNMRLRALQHLKAKEVPVTQVEGLTPEQKREFIIKDNASFGEWDWDVLANEWDANQLKDWGLDVPLISETEKLSKLEFVDVYYQPIEKPTLRLNECVDMSKYEAKIKVIEQSPLTEEQKTVMRLFAYRFIKIDFENVANFYFFNATEDEQKVMERLRLVLCDSGLHGFIEDDLLRMYETVQIGEND